MIVLFETAAGYALFKVLNENKLQETENIWKEFESPEKASKVVKLLSFKKFKDTTDALAAATSLIDGKISKSLKKFMKKCVIDKIQEPIAVADAKLGAILKEKFSLSCVSNSSIIELMRGIRMQMDSLIDELPRKELAAMSLGLAHSLSRYKLKFSPEKIDTMIIQAVSLLDDLDKELNNYVMRCREWYGWHFPELGKIVSDSIAFAKVVIKMGFRVNASSTDLSDILPEDLEMKVKEAAEISMGTEISDVDIANIKHLCDQVLEISNYRTQLYEYLKHRMMALAPNLTVLLGELVGARLIAHAGSLMNLAKYPASTVQILGAEKALFRALKTKRDTPKYGLIYHAQLIGQAPGSLKGKISRSLAAKAALGCRVDALGDDSGSQLGLEHRARLENRIKFLTEHGTTRFSGTGKEKMKFQSYKVKGETAPYDTAVDSTIPRAQKRKFEEIKKEEEPEEAAENVEATSPTKKKMKKEKHVPVVEEVPEVPEVTSSPKKKKGKAKQQSAEPENIPEEVEEPAPAKKKKKQKKAKKGSDDEDDE